MRNAFSFATLVSLCACAGGTAGNEAANNAMVCNAYVAHQSHVEAVSEGTVTRVFGERMGRTSPHEGFLMHLNSNCDVIVRVEANTDFTGYFPVRAGDHVRVKGEYEYYPIGGVIHWTHRDPRGRHPGGWIEAGGHTYD